MTLGPSSIQGILRVKFCPMQCAAAYLPISEVAIYCGDGCINRPSRRRINARLGRWSLTNALHESRFEAYKIEVLGV